MSVRSETVERTLLVPLTEEEKAHQAEEMAALCGQIDSLEERKKAAASELKAQIDELELEVSTRARSVRQGDLRPVSVLVVYDYVDGMVTETRVDTGEEIGRRGMTPEERQDELPLAERDGDGAAAEA